MTDEYFTEDNAKKILALNSLPGGMDYTEVEAFIRRLVYRTYPNMTDTTDRLVVSIMFLKEWIREIAQVSPPYVSPLLEKARNALFLSKGVVQS